MFDFSTPPTTVAAEVEKLGKALFSWVQNFEEGFYLFIYLFDEKVGFGKWRELLLMEMVIFIIIRVVVPWLLVLQKGMIEQRFLSIRWVGQVHPKRFGQVRTYLYHSSRITQKKLHIFSFICMVRYRIC